MTPDIVAVSHPVPLRYRLANGRETIAFRRELTPVRLRWLDDVEVRAPGPDTSMSGKVNHRLVHGAIRVAEGRAWVMAGRPTPYDWDSLVPVTVEDMARALLHRREDVGWCHETNWLTRANGLTRAWAYRAPFGPRKASWFVNSSYLTDGLDSVMSRESVEWLSRKATLVEDHATEAREALRRLFDEEVRVVEGKVLVAFQGVHATVRPAMKGGRRPSRWGYTTYPWYAQRGDHRSFCVPPDPAGLPPRFAHVLPDEPRTEDEIASDAIPAFLATLPVGEPGRQAVSMHAHDLALRVAYWANGKGRRDPEADLAPVMRLAALATIGAIPPDGEAHAFRTVTDFARSAWSWARPGGRRTEVDELLAYVDDVALPALGAADPGVSEPGDLDALAGIA